MLNDKALIKNGDMDLMTLGEVMVKSGFFQDSHQASQAIVKILAGRELGFGPIASMTGVNIIKGRVTLSANLIAAAIKRSGRYNYRVTHQDDSGVTLEFSENGQPVGNSSFTNTDAQRAGLLNGDNWKKYPRNMYFARAISNGAKWFCPDVFNGPVYTPDEMGAGVDGETGEVINLPAEEAKPEPIKAEEKPAPAQPVAPVQPAQQPRPQVSTANDYLPSTMQELLELVNRRVQAPYDNVPHLFNAIRGEIPGGRWSVPGRNDKDGWRQAYDVAIKHAEAKVNKSEAQSIPAGEVAKQDEIPF